MISFVHWVSLLYFIFVGLLWFAYGCICICVYSVTLFIVVINLCLYVGVLQFCGVFLFSFFFLFFFLFFFISSSFRFLKAIIFFLLLFLCLPFPIVTFLLTGKYNLWFPLFDGSIYCTLLLLDCFHFAHGCICLCTYSIILIIICLIL